MQKQKGKAFDSLLNANSVESLSHCEEFPADELTQSAAILADADVKRPELMTGLDINEDFVSDASSEHKLRMKKVQYEMDQHITDSMF